MEEKPEGGAGDISLGWLARPCDRAGSSSIRDREGPRPGNPVRVRGYQTREISPPQMNLLALNGHPGVSAFVSALAFSIRAHPIQNASQKQLWHLRHTLNEFCSSRVSCVRGKHEENRKHRRSHPRAWPPSTGGGVYRPNSGPSMCIPTICVMGLSASFFAPGNCLSHHTSLRSIPGVSFFFRQLHCLHTDFDSAFLMYPWVST